MSKELIVSSGRHETRVAILEDDQVVELFHEREKEYSLAGSIHKGRVTRVLPGMQSAFVDIGLERDAFLYVSDFFEDNEEYDAVVSTVEEKVLKMEKGGDAARDFRVERPEPTRQPLIALPAESPVEENIAVEAAPPAAQPQGRPEGNRDGRPDRGGRGRRGRRRRGGRGGGLPESKFFSPRAEAGAPAEERETESDDLPQEETAEVETFTPVSRASQLDDFMVLPGESLAKYSPSEPKDEVESEELTETTEAARVEITPQEQEPQANPGIHAAPAEPPVESALPEEHPLAGFGAVASWVNTPVAPETTEEEVTGREDADPAEPEQAESLASAIDEPESEASASEESASEE
jgi:ribonuclease G